MDRRESGRARFESAQGQSGHGRLDDRMRLVCDEKLP